MKVDDFKELGLIYEAFNVDRTNSGPTGNTNFTATDGIHSYGRGMPFNGTGKTGAFELGQMNQGVTPIGDEEEVAGDINKQTVVNLIDGLLDGEDNQSVIFALTKLKKEIVNRK